MTVAGSAAGDAWEREKFRIEIGLRERELALAEARLKADRRRNLIISALIPITVTLMTLVPTVLSSRSDRLLQRSSYEAQLVVDSVRTGDPDQAAVNLEFLVKSGLLRGDTADRVREYLQERQPGQGRVLPR